jgi:cytosine/creatinine deaminase
MAIDFAIRKPTDIGVEGGLIAAIERGFVCDAAEHDAGGKLVCGGLIETCRCT